MTGFSGRNRRRQKKTHNKYYCLVVGATENIGRGAAKAFLNTGPRRLLLSEEAGKSLPILLGGILTEISVLLAWLLIYPRLKVHKKLPGQQVQM
jgi:hypothetical protein